MTMRWLSSSVFVTFVLFVLGAEVARSDEVVFPKGFKWCAATAAHQVEGDNTNSDWWAWEQIPGKIKNGETSAKTTDHWNRVAQDIQILKDLGVTQYRFSVEWAKIETAPGVWNSDAISHYQNEIASLRAVGIEPIITLHHFTLPLWVAQQGGLEWAGFPDRFEKYTKVVVTQIAPKEGLWVTFNEPLVVALMGYTQGIFPPGLKRPLAGVKEPVIGILKAHARAYRVIHDLARPSDGSLPRVGMAHHLRAFAPSNWYSPLDRYAASLLDVANNWAIPDAMETGVFKISIPFTLSINEKIEGLAHSQDYVGINYYSRDLIAFHFGANPPFERLVKAGAPVSDLGWEIYPEGFYEVLKAAHKRYKKPILITENGIADSKDQLRTAFIKDHLKQVLRAIKDGVVIEDYCYWALLDNFEWIEGFTPRFGLYEVNYSTFARTPRPSAIWFSNLTRQNGFH